MTDAAPHPEYRHIARHIRKVALAPHGQKRALERTLVKKRLASLKREIASRLSPGREGGTGSGPTALSHPSRTAWKAS